MRALRRYCWLSSRFISMRVLFQILMAMATHMTDDRTTSAVYPQFVERIENNQCDGTKCASSITVTSTPAHANSGSIAQFPFAYRISLQSHGGMLKKRKGPKCQ